MNPEGRRRARANQVFRVGALALAVLLAATVATACSSSKKKATSPTSVSSSSAPAGAAEAEIRNVFTKIVDPSVPLAQKPSMIQAGDQFQSAIAELAALPQAKSVSITVSKVVLNSAQKATVTYTILLSGSPVLPDQTGYAVNTDGHWKVAGTTLCGLLTANGQNPAVCSLPAATSLPS